MGLTHTQTQAGNAVWKAHDLRVVKGTQGHYVHAADLDGDGDDDLVAATHAENTVAVFYASTACALLLPAVLLDERVPGAARATEFIGLAG